MKTIKHFLFSFAVLGCLLWIVPVFAAESAPQAVEAVTVLVDGAAVEGDVPAQIVNDRAMLPFRAILEKLGADVDWDGEYQIITAVRGKTVLNMRIGKPIMVRINLEDQTMEQISLDAPPMIISERTMVPVRAIAEALDAAVGWDPQTRTASVQTEPSLEEAR